MYRLKVKIGKVWKLSLDTYETLEDAKTRQNELKVIGAKSVIVDKLGGKL